MAVTLPGNINGVSMSNIRKIGATLDNPPTLWLLNNINYPCVTSGLEGWWRFQETSGTTLNDTTANARNGTLQGTNTFSVQAGKIRNCHDFVGSSSDYIVVPYTSALNAGPISIAFWARVDGGSGSNRSPATSRNIVSTVCTGWSFYVNTSNRFSFWTANGGTSFTQTGPSTGSITEGQWYHICGIHNGTTAVLWIDGTNSYSNTVGYTANSARDMRIGADQTEGSANFLFNGAIDDFRIYSRALTTNEVKKLAGVA